MKIREKYTSLQVKAYYEKFLKGKITDFQMAQIIHRCTVPVEYFRYGNRFFFRRDIKSNFSNETMELFLDFILPQYFSYSNGKNRNYVDAYKDDMKNRLTDFLEMDNVSKEIKQKLMVYASKKSMVVFEKMLKCNFNNDMIDPKVIVDGILNEWNSSSSSSYDTNETVSVLLAICKLYKNEYLGKEIEQYTYEKTNSVINFDSLNHLGAKNRFNIYFNQYINVEAELYGTVKYTIKDNINNSIKNLVNENLPFGMCIKAFIEVLTEDIVSLEPEMVEQLNASILAYKLLKTK